VREINDQIETHTNELEKVQIAAELLRRAQKLIQLSRRLEALLAEKSQELSQAAIIIKDIGRSQNGKSFHDSTNGQIYGP
jgi:short-subunit dehydrogenase